VHAPFYAALDDGCLVLVTSRRRAGAGRGLLSRLGDLVLAARVTVLHVACRTLAHGAHARDETLLVLGLRAGREGGRLASLGHFAARRERIHGEEERVGDAGAGAVGRVVRPRVAPVDDRSEYERRRRSWLLRRKEGRVHGSDVSGVVPCRAAWCRGGRRSVLVSPVFQNLLEMEL